MTVELLLKLAPLVSVAWWVLALAHIILTDRRYR